MAPTPLQNKTAAVGRLIKDHRMYKQEVEDQLKKIDQMKSNNSDEYELNRADRVLKDTEQMLPNVRQKIEQYVTSLKELISNTTEEDTTDAQARLKEAEEYLTVN